MIEDLKFALHLIIHPFDGFWDMKYEKRGKLKIAFLFIFLWIVTNIFSRQASGFLFNYAMYSPLDIWYELRKVLIIFVLFTLANWSVTTLMDGKGNMKDIMMAFGYSCLPMILIRIPLVIFTNVATYMETGYINFFDQLSWYWFIALLFFGIMIIHEYSLPKNVFTAVLTIVSMGVISFVCIVFFNLLWQMVGFVAAVYQEIMLRL